MFLSRNINRLPCRTLCRTLLTDTKISKNTTNPLLVGTQVTETKSDWMKFAPNLTKFDLGIQHHGQNIRKEIIDVPLIPNKIIDDPVSIIKEIDEINKRIQEIRLPDVVRRNVDENGMRAEVKKNNKPLGIMIIRRKKMKKHKRRKLWKRMRFEWAKRRQRREFRKEKLFQAEQVAKIKEAEKFSAEQYVEEKIKKAVEVPLPRYWKGKRLPAFIIKDLVEEDRLKKQRRKEKEERIEKYRHWKL